MTRPELLVVTGLHAPGVEAVIGRIRAIDPHAAVLHHDLREIGSGRVHRRLRRGRTDETERVELVHGCLSCTLREDLLPRLRALAGPGGPRRIVLHLDPALEPEPVCWSLLNVPVDGSPITEVVDLRGVVTAVDTGHWPDDATGDESPADADAATWDAVPAERRAIASMGWHPRYGDRAQDLVVLAHDADTDEITDALSGALLTEAELLGGEEAWRALPDPFGWWSVSTVVE